MLMTAQLIKVTEKGLQVKARLRVQQRVRIFPKPPGQAVDREEPILLKRGETVLDLAAKIHRDLAAKLKSARLWGNSEGAVSGRWVARDHVLEDQDVIELEF